MSDLEREYVIENEALRAELARVREIAGRVLTAAMEAQDAAVGHPIVLGIFLLLSGLTGLRRTTG
jgi:hypothetical protein